LIVFVVLKYVNPSKNITRKKKRGINPKNEGFFVLLRREEKCVKNPPILGIFRILNI
jgi:hypothetical protein